MLATLPRV